MSHTNRNSSTVLAKLLILAALAGSCVPVLAGPLNPPAGPVVSTYKTLNEVEPRLPIDSTYAPGDTDAVFKISSAGSYYATGSVTIFGARAYLEIAASNVTVDLNGFRISGSPGTIDGIFLAPGVHNVRILNGTIASFSQDGIDFTGAQGCSLEDLTVTGCGATGIRSGYGAILRDCLVTGSGNVGYNLATGSTATACTARANTSIGFFASGPSVLTQCTSTANSDSGFHITGGSVVSDCTASFNSTYGVSCVFGSDSITLTNNAIIQNTTAGILASNGVLVKGNSVTTPGNAPSIVASGNGNRIEGNSTRGTGLSVSIPAGLTDNFVVANWHYSGNGSNGFTGVNAASNVVGPIVTSAGTITTTNPWANFSR